MTADANGLPLDVQPEVIPPSPAHTTTPRTSVAAETTFDPLEAFFGRASASTSTPTRESRHDRRISQSEILPPYTECATPPEYQEPATLAMYLFKFGWLFPPFWIMGAFILVSTLRPPPPAANEEVWMPEKTPAEREELIARMRTVEIKWGRRCLYALIGLAVVAVVAAVTAVIVKHT